MADLKISQLGSIVTVVPATDVLPVVQGATTYKVTPNQILGSGGVATLASATITGDLTVDTNVLKVDTTNNRVGIVTTTPLFPLDVSGSGITGFPIRLISASGTSIRFDTGRSYTVNRNWIVGCDEITEGVFAIVPSTALGGSTFTNPVYKVSYDGIHTFLDGAGGTRMTLNSTSNLVLAGGNAAANGVGVTFPATQSASSDANCLDDYEEGTFTPTIGGTATYTTQSGRYTKIGNRVYASIRLTVLLVGTGSSSAISGLPFVVSTNPHPVSVGYFTNLAISVNYISGYADNGTSIINMTATTAATTNITNGAAVIGNGTDLAISFFYEV